MIIGNEMNQKKSSQEMIIGNEMNQKKSSQEMIIGNALNQKGFNIIHPSPNVIHHLLSKLLPKVVGCHFRLGTF